MSDIFNLPNNAHNFYRKGRNARDHGDYQEAIACYEKSYALQEELTVLQELVELYLATANKASLEKLWKDTFAQTPLDQQDYQHTLLYAHSLNALYDCQAALIELYQLKDHFLAEEWDSQPLDQLIEKTHHLKKVQDLVSQATSPQAIDQLIDQFHQGGPLDFLEQIKTLYQLQISQVKPLLIAVLKRADTLHFVKGDILHYLIYQGLEDQVTLHWFGKDYQIDLATLKDYKKDPTYQAVLEEIEDYSQLNNPNLGQELINHFNLLIMVYYPFIDQAIPHPTKWVQLFLYYYDLEDQTPDLANSQTATYLEQAFREINLLLKDSWTSPS